MTLIQRFGSALNLNIHFQMLLLDGVYVEEGERLCRYIARPAVATQRLSLTAQRQVRYQLKTPYRDGATHVLFEPVDCMAHIPVRHPPGDLRSCKSALLRIPAMADAGSGDGGLPRSVATQAG